MDPARRSRLRRIALEPLEPRTLLAVLPAPLVSGQATISGSRGDESSPSIAIDRANPRKLVTVWTRDDPLIGGDTTTIVEGRYSNDGGQTWSVLGSLGGAMRDPTTPSTAPKNFAQITDASVAFGPGDAVYVLTSQHSTSNGTGALVLQAYDFSGNAPVSGLRNVVREWIQDPAFTPMLAVDDNLPSYTDTDANGVAQTQTDPYSGTVYIAWASQDAAPAFVPDPANFNPNSIYVIASADGGQTFTTSRILNDGGHSGTARNATPRLAISQGAPGASGTARVSGGQVTVVWDDFGSLSTANPPVDAIVSDRIQDGGVGHSFFGAGGGITDNNTTDFTIPVTLPANSNITDLNVTVNLDHPDLGELTLTLIAPDGRQITLIANQAAGANLGTTASGIRLGTVFDSDATRNIVDFNGTTRGASAPFTGSFRPQSGNLRIFNTIDGSSLNGPWKLQITDNKASNVGNLVNWSLNFTEGLTDGNDVRVATTGTLRGSLDSPFPLKPVVSPDRGIAPAPVIASDNTLGAFSPYQGRLYVAYTGRANVTGNPADNTDVYLSYSDDGGLTWTRATRFNDDNAAADGFSEASFSSGRPQFQPQLAVDQTTGTLVASFLDARYDAARARVVTTITASVDGGQTFSPQVYANANRTATDAATGQTVNLGPVPENQSSGNSLRETSFGFGDRQGLAVAGGKIYPAWAGNHDGGGDGKALLDILTASVAIASGPRIVQSTMGPVGLPGDTVNGSRTADGSPQASAFEVTFDRPVDPSTFDLNDVRVYFTDTQPGNPTGRLVPVLSVVPLDLGFFGPGQAQGATRFRINFEPSSAVGTYSYTVSPDVRDRVRNVAPIILPGATAKYTAPTSFSSVSTINVPTVPVGQVVRGVVVNLTVNAFYAPDLTLTLVAPDGTSVVLSRMNGTGSFLNAQGYFNTTFDDSAPQPISTGVEPFSGTFRPDQPLSRLTGKGAVGNWTLQITGSFPGNVSQINWSLVVQTGPLANASPGNFMDQNSNALTGETFADIFAAPRPVNGFGVSGILTAPFDQNTLPLIVPGPHLVRTFIPPIPGGAPGTTDSTTLPVLNGTVSFLDVSFDRPMRPSSFTPDDVLRIIGPYGEVPRSAPGAPGVDLYTVTPDPQAGEDPSFPRTFRIGFPTQQLSGTYIVTLKPSILSKTGDAVDSNLNAGVDLLFGKATAGQTTPISYNSSDTPTPIPDSGSISSQITITDNFVIQGASLRLNITHTNDPDLQAYLLAPDGTRIQLFTHIGGTGTRANFTNTTFNDSANTLIQNGGAPFNNGPYKPQQALSTLNGRLSAGIYTLVIQDDAAGNTGTLVNWTLTLQKPVSASGLGEPAADVISTSFRIFTMDPTNPLSSNTWTAVGPAARGDSGRIGGLAMDPSDPSGNTVYVGGASGGIWKTTNFLAPGGPTYIPLTDFGPTFGINIGGIAVFGRNGDPNQSIVFAATGEGDTGSQGVGVLRSMDGGATWTLLDSTDNTLPFDSPLRDHQFAKNGGTTSFKVLVDPKLGPSGVIVYAAFSGGNGGVWRSDDSGMHWKLMRSGQATDIVLDPNSGTGGPNGNLQILYAGFRGEGVFFSPNRGQVFNLMVGGVGNPLIVDTTRNNPVNVTNPVDTPNGGKGRIVLAKPELTGNPAQDLIYQGWLYAGVVKPDSHFDGLYLTKDFGQNWTKLRIPTLPPVSSGGVTTVRAVPTNDYNSPNVDYDIGGGPAGSGLPAQGNYDVSLAIDPTNPNVVYLGGTRDGQPTGFIRIDATLVKGPHQLVPFDPTRPDGGGLLVNSIGGLTLDDITKTPPPPYLNLIRDPNQPFVAGATISTFNSNTFVNDGSGVRWTPFDIGVTDQHRIYTFKDPLTGHARIVTGDDQGVFTAVDDNGTFSNGIGTAPFASGSRNGNLQITQFYYGAAQPSNLAAQIAGALFYGSAQDNGGPVSSSDVLESGNIVWSGPGGDAGGVGTDQQGSGTLYQFWWPCCGGNRTDFFQVNGVGRTFGLLQASNPGPTPDPQWPNTFGANFTVNPLRGDEQNGQVVISSAAGRVFLTETAGRFWFPIAEPSDLDGRIARVQAFGAPDPNGPSGGVNLDDFLYLGTDGGHIYVTQTGGGGSTSRQWTNLSAGLDGSSIQSIVTNPTRGSHEAYAVTSRGVYHIADSLATGATWTNITGNLFQLTHDIFSGRNQAGISQTETQARVLTSAVADWRYVIPNDFANPPTANPSDPDLTHPMLYVAGEGGVYRSADDGVTWTLYPSQDPASLNTTPTPPGDGGGLANAHVSDLDLALGNIDPTTGRANEVGGPNLLVATTFGRGTFAIRLAPYIFPNSVQLDPASDSGEATPPGQVPVTNDVRPIFHGLGQQSAFGNVVTVNLIDETDPANPIIIGTGQTDELGRFTVQVNPGVYQTDGSSDGTKLIGVQSITSSGTAGNIATFSFTLDRTSPLAPSTPALSLTLPAPNGSDLGISNTDNITSNNAPFFDIVNAEPTTTVTLLRDGVAVATRVGPGPIQDLGPVPDGTHLYQATQTDPAGNVSPLSGSLTVVIDTTIPATPRTPVLLDDSGVPGDRITNVKSPRFTGTVDVDAAGGLIQLVDPAGTIVGTATIASDGRYTVQPGSSLTDGVYTFRVIAMDVAGNRSAPSPSITVTILSRTPAQPTLTLVATDDSGVPGDGITNVRNPRLTGRATPGLIVELVAAADLRKFPSNELVTAGTVITTALVKTDGTYLIQFPYLLADQNVRVVARVRDVAGNTSSSNPLTITIDGTPPMAVVVLSLSPADDTGTKGDNRTSSRRPHLIGTTEPGQYVDLVRSDGLVLATAISGSDGKFSLQPPFNLSNGTIALQARVRDIAGNQGAPSNTVTLTITSTPNDFDGDGTSDLVTFRQGQWVILQSSAGLKVVDFGATTDIPLMGDFDGDGIADLAVFRPSTAQWFIIRSRDGAFVTQFGAANGDIPVAQDFDGDGVTDLAVYRPTTGQWFILQSRDGARVESFGTANLDVPIPADFDGDGKADLAVYRPTEARWMVRFSSGADGINNTFGAPNTDVPVPADYDGDGQADQAVYRPSTSQWFVIKSAGGVIPGLVVGNPNDIPAPLDYDGDGKADLTTFRPATGQWFILQSSTNTQRTQVLGLATDAVPVAAPYDYRRLRAKLRWQL